MTKEKQRIAILKLTGYKPYAKLGSSIVLEKDGNFRNLSDLPNHLNNRDAVADVLNSLKASQYPHFQEDYVNNLRIVVERDLLKVDFSRHGVHWFEVLNATPEQQCEAILWATGEYKD